MCVVRAKIRPTNTFIEFEKAEIEQSIPSRFEQQVTQHSARLAVKTKSQALTYDALNRNANRIARSILDRRGPGEETIALLLEPGAMMITAILGILKTGKIFTPVDPSYPRARISYILEDSQAA